MTGATADTNGASGTVPAPTAGQESLFLRGDGTWAQGGGYIVFPELSINVDTMELIANGGDGIDLSIDTDGNLIADIL